MSEQATKTAQLVACHRQMGEFSLQINESSRVTELAQHALKPGMSSDGMQFLVSPIGEQKIVNLSNYEGSDRHFGMHNDGEAGFLLHAVNPDGSRRVIAE